MGLGYDQSGAAQINTGGSLAYMLARAVTLFITLFLVHIRYVLIATLGLIFIGLCITLGLASAEAPGWTWMGVILITGGMGPNFPAIYSVVNDHITVTDGIGSIMWAFTGLVSATTPLLVSHWIDSRPEVITYMGFGCVIMISMALGLLHCFTFQMPPTSNTLSKEKEVD